MATTTSLAVWGVQVETPTDIAQKTEGYITSFDKNSEMMVGDEQNELGAVIGKHKYDEKSTVTVSLIVAADVEPPTIGKQITIDNVKYYVTSAAVTESNSDFRKLRVTAERYEDCEKAVNAKDRSEII